MTAKELEGAAEVIVKEFLADLPARSEPNGSINITLDTGECVYIHLSGNKWTARSVDAKCEVDGTCDWAAKTLKRGATRNL